MNPSIGDESIAVTITMNIRGNGGKHLYGPGDRLLYDIKTPNRTGGREGYRSLLNDYANVKFNGSCLRLVYRVDSRLSRNFFFTREAEAGKKCVNSFSILFHYKD